MQKKFISKDKKTLLIILELLEYILLVCDLPIHNCVNDKEFLIRLGKLLNANN